MKDIETRPAEQFEQSLCHEIGLYAFANSLADAERLQRELEVGVLSINNFGTPDADTSFEGVKVGGIGREGGPTSLDARGVQKAILQHRGSL